MATVELCKVPSKTHMYVSQIIVKINLLTYYFSLIFKAPQIMFSFWPYMYDNRSILQKRSCLQNSAIKLLVRLSIRLGIMNIACTQKKIRGKFLAHFISNSQTLCSRSVFSFPISTNNLIKKSAKISCKLRVYAAEKLFEPA